MPRYSCASSKGRIENENSLARWNDFRSDQYQTFEKRKCHVTVIRTEADHRDINERIGPFWGAFLSPPAASIQIGTRYVHGVGYGEPELRDGRYVLIVEYSESKTFGKMALTRKSLKQVPFAVKDAR